VAAAVLAIACAASTRVAHDTAHAPAKASADAAARDAYGLARFFLQRSDAGDLERARDEFEKAIAADHSFADAYAGLASTYWRMTIRGDLPRDRGAALLRAAAERALALAPDLAEAHLRLANYAAIVPDGDRFGTHEALARQAEPGNALVLAVDSSDALADGRLDEGVALARRAAAAEPLSSVYRYNLAAALFLAGRFEEAKQVNLAEVNIDPHALTDVAAEVLILDERFDEALALAAAWPDGAARDETEALAYYGLHRTDAADAALARLIEDARDSDPLRIVEVYAYRGETDRALGWLAIGADWYRRGIQPCPGSCLVPWSLRLSPFTASLHDDARWRSWAANVGES
jgi:tetratricopeptide (TPR) repeat protein